MHHPLLIIGAALWSSSLLAQVVFTESGPWVAPAGVTQATFELIGAGGNGAANGGGGGGGGAYLRGTYTVTPGNSYPIVVGAGGSELGTIVGGMGLIAGAGGNAITVANPNIGGGGAAGTPVGGQVSRSGGSGGGGYATYFGGGGGGAGGTTGNGGAGGNAIVYNGSNCLWPGGTGGTPGGGIAGNGGKGAGFTDNTCTAADAAQDGHNYGGGGGGGNGNSSPPGLGGGGVCIITWSGMMGVAATDADALRLASTTFTDRIELRNTTGMERYELLDDMGRMLWSGVRIEEQDLSGLRAGTYLLRVTGNGAGRAMHVVKL